MKDPHTDELIARALKGKLTRPEQEAFDRRLREDASFRQEWRTEESLEAALRALPDAPISSNFTSLVLQAALKAERPAPSRPQGFRFVFAKLAAAVTGVAVIALAVFHQHESVQRRELAEAVNTFNKVALVVGSDQLPPMEVFENFETIQRLSLPAESEMDMELLLALQK